MSEEKIILNDANLDMVQGGRKVSHNLDTVQGGTGVSHNLDELTKKSDKDTSDGTGISDNMQKQIEKLTEMSNHSAD